MTEYNESDFEGLTHGIIFRFRFLKWTAVPEDIKNNMVNYELKRLKSLMPKLKTTDKLFLPVHSTIVEKGMCFFGQDIRVINKYAILEAFKKLELNRKFIISYNNHDGYKYWSINFIYENDTDIINTLNG
jgi:hypothetical protein